MFLKLLGLKQTHTSLFFLHCLNFWSLLLKITVEQYNKKNENSCTVLHLKWQKYLQEFLWLLYKYFSERTQAEVNRLLSPAALLVLCWCLWLIDPAGKVTRSRAAGLSRTQVLWSASVASLVHKTTLLLPCCFSSVVFEKPLKMSPPTPCPSALLQNLAWKVELKTEMLR